MTKRDCQKALYVLAALLFGITANGMTQEAPTLSCAGGGNCPEPPIAITAMGGPQVGVVSTGGMVFAIPANADLVKNQPYEAQAVTEIEQTLAEGTHITQTTTATVARDSSGRTARIQKLSTIGPWKSASDSSQSEVTTLTTIFDPVAKTHTDYTSDSNVAHVLTMPAPPTGTTKGQISGFAMAGPIGPGPGAEGPGPMAFAVHGHFAPGESGASPNVKTESLGDKTIAGIAVTGTKTTNTIPAGTIGNDQDIVVTRETWYSPDLKLVIQSTQTDPRFGETTYSLTNIQHSEPDPALFQVPAGYKVEKVPVVLQPN
jgi:hypothetical protein